MKTDIMNATTENDIIHITKQADLDHIEMHISALHELMKEDGDEYSVRLNSLKNFVMFLIDHHNISTSQVGVTPDSFVDMIWDSSDNTITLFLEFLPTNKILFVMLKELSDSNKPQFTSGTISVKRIKSKIKSICPQFYNNKLS